MSSHSTYLVGLTVTIACTASVVAAGTAAATTFDGRCTGDGVVRASRPLTFAPTIAGLSFQSSGTCTGLVDGRAVVDAPFVGSSAGDGGLLSCAGGAVQGTGTLRLFPRTRRERRLRIRFSNLTLASDSVFTLTGADGGLAYGRHQFAPDAASLDACLGTGLQSVGNTIAVATVQPIRG